jgi:hypothetical protein
LCNVKQVTRRIRKNCCASTTWHPSTNITDPACDFLDEENLTCRKYNEPIEGYDCEVNSFVCCKSCASEK